MKLRRYEGLQEETVCSLSVWTMGFSSGLVKLVFELYALQIVLELRLVIKEH